MRHSIAVAGLRYHLRPLRVDDAEFLLSLRLRAGIREHVNATSDRVCDQRAWIEQRHRSETDYSFVLDDCRGTPTGSFSIYEYDGRRRRARIGRWLVRPGSRSVPEFALMGYFVCFSVLELESVYCRIPSDNLAALAFQRRIKSAVRGETSRVELNGRNVGLLEFETSRADWPALFAMLYPLASSVCARSLDEARSPGSAGKNRDLVSSATSRGASMSLLASLGATMRSRYAGEPAVEPAAQRTLAE